jgi:phosphoribosylamine--glycine ligase
MSDKKINILLLGAGGREHALAWKLSQSPLLGNIYFAPGNAGTSNYGQNLPFGDSDFDAIHRFVSENDINMVVVGPENPLVMGIHDYFLQNPELSHIPVIGPLKLAAQLEGSKDFAKAFMSRHDIPTASYQTFTSQQYQEAVDFLKTFSPPYVLKADGLAAGKGVVICNTAGEAETELNEMLLKAKFGHASAKVVIEQFLDGIEMSAFVLTDGKSYKMLPEAKDYKRIGNNDTGPNTGGMGCVSPVPFVTPDFMQKVESRIIKPTIDGLINDGIGYKGFIFFGLMNVNGDPFVIEYNCRLGDPETEVILPRLNNDLLDLFLKVAYGNLNEAVIEISPDTALCIMMVSEGYPGNYPKGKEISGLDEISDALAFHAGTIIDPKVDHVVTNGGRVIGLVATAKNLVDARKIAYDQVKLINFDGACFREDIGNDLLKYL